MSYLSIKVIQHLNEMTTRLSNRPGLLEVTRRLRIELMEYCSISIGDNAIFWLNTRCESNVFILCLPMMSYLSIKVIQHLNETTTRLSNRPGLLELTERLRTELLEYCSISIYNNGTLSGKISDVKVTFYIMSDELSQN